MRFSSREYAGWMVAVVAFAAGVALAGCGGGAATGGDPVAGEELFKTELEDEPGNHACNDCHPRGTHDGTSGPTMQGIAERAGERVAGMSAEEYLRQSIVDPSAYVVEDYSNELMPKVYGEILSDEDISNLIAYLVTL